MEIGKVPCPKCEGVGSYPEHDPNSRDPETGEHDCRYCPIEVECEECEGTGKISRKKAKEFERKEERKAKERDEMITRLLQPNKDLPF
jgi:RecJ-like exonuclease